MTNQLDAKRMRILRRGIAFLIAAIALTRPPVSCAQAPGEPIEAAEPASKDAALITQAKSLQGSGRLLSREMVVALIKTPEPSPLVLPPPSVQPLSAKEVAARARRGLVRIGWSFLCPHCNNWHLQLAGGYAISADGAVATCAHCIEPKETMREGYLIAVDSSDTVLPVKTVLAINHELDAAILRVTGGRLTPLPLNSQVTAGDAAYLFSDFLNIRGYFSSGIVNRFYWQKGTGSVNADTLAGVQKLRLNVSTDWAPGSSGAAVLDGCGNAIGHVAVIDPLHEGGAPKQKGTGASNDKSRPDDRFHGDSLVTLHEAVPARGVILLAESMAGSSKVIRHGGK